MVLDTLFPFRLINSPIFYFIVERCLAIRPERSSRTELDYRNNKIKAIDGPLMKFFN